MGLFIAKVNNPVAFLPDPATVSPQARTPSSPKTEMEPQVSRMKKERWKQSKGSGREEGFTAKFAKFAKLDRGLDKKEEDRKICQDRPHEPKYRSWVSIFHRSAEVAKERRALHVGR